MEVSINGGTPIAGWFIFWEHPTKMDDLGVTPFQETSTYFKVMSPADGGHVIFFHEMHEFFSHELRLIIDPKKSSTATPKTAGWFTVSEISSSIFHGGFLLPGHPKSDARRDAGHLGTGSFLMSAMFQRAIGTHELPR